MQDVIAITNRRLCDRPFLEQIERVCKLYPAAVILREKDLSDAEYAALAADVYSVCKKYNVRLILHTYVAVAEKTGINAIHLSIDNLRKYHSQLKDSYKRLFNPFRSGSCRSGRTWCFIHYGRTYI